LYRHLKISHPIKTFPSLLLLNIILLLSLIPMMSYSADEKTDNIDEFCVVATFSYLVDWGAKAIKRIENEHFAAESSPDAVIEEPKIVLDLSMPDIKHEGTMAIDKGQTINFPDLFSAQTKKSYSKEAPSRSFGGRILMDDAELESMEQYRLNNIGAAVRGAEVSLEFKTN
jgi:hypothetical protein